MKYQVPDTELRGWVEQVANDLCLTVRGDFDHLIRLDVNDDTLEKLQMLVNFVLDNARRATEAKETADRLARANRQLLSENSRIREMGSYRLERLLGSGGMGEVWLGRHRLLARPAAIKRITPEKLGHGSGSTARLDHVISRFEREARATAGLRSPHTVEVYDFGVHAGDFYYVMECLHGMDLQRMVREHGPLAPDRVVWLLGQVCHSLHEAHSIGLIHRDIKPSNLFACRHGIDDDFVKVLDFGLVKQTRTATETQLTQDGVFSGTPAYASPEQVLQLKEIDGRSDMYSLGCVAWFLLTGSPLFQDRSPVGVLMQHVKEAPPSLYDLGQGAIPADLADVVTACLAKRPDDRPASAAELQRALDSTGLAAHWTRDRRAAWWDQHAPPDPCSLLIADPGAATNETATMDASELATEE